MDKNTELSMSRKKLQQVSSKIFKITVYMSVIAFNCTTLYFENINLICLGSYIVHQIRKLVTAYQVQGNTCSKR